MEFHSYVKLKISTFSFLNIFHRPTETDTALSSCNALAAPLVSPRAAVA